MDGLAPLRRGGAVGVRRGRWSGRATAGRGRCDRLAHGQAGCGGAHRLLARTTIGSPDRPSSSTAVVARADRGRADLDAGALLQPAGLAGLLGQQQRQHRAAWRRPARCGRSGAGSPCGRPAGRSARPGRRRRRGCRGRRRRWRRAPGPGPRRTRPAPACGRSGPGCRGWQPASTPARRSCWPAGRRRAWCGRRSASGPGGRRSRRSTATLSSWATANDAVVHGRHRRRRGGDRVDRPGRSGTAGPACRPRGPAWRRTAAAGRRPASCRAAR